METSEETNIANSSHSKALRATLEWTPQSLPALRQILTYQPEILTHKDAQGNTIFHSLASHGNAVAFKALFDGGLLTSRELMTRNSKGNTPLHEAARFGRVNVVSIILERERETVSARNNLGETPLYVAAASGEKMAFDLLKGRVDREEVVRRDDGRTILHAAVDAEYYKLALNIMESFPNLARSHMRDNNKTTALHLLANKPMSFNSGSSYSLKNIGSRPFVPLQFLICLVYLCIPVNKSEILDGDEAHPYQNEHGMSQSKGTLVKKLFSGLEYAKQKHACALELAKRLIAKEEDWSHYTYCAKDEKNPLLQAMENSIDELVEEILVNYPEAAYTIDSNGKNIFHIAVEKKDEHMYNFLKKSVVNKEGMMTDVDAKGNSIMHLAACEGRSNPRILLGYLNQMAWDVYWLKLVCYDSPAYFPRLVNSVGKTATELFEENHSKLRENAEKVLKEMNDGLMLVSALVGTVNYAAIFTLPGGFDTSNRETSSTFGHPILYNTDKEGKLLIFMWYTGVALFAAFIALVMMVAIQLSKFLSSDFFMALPFRFIAALTALYISVVFTIAAAFVAYDIIDIKFPIYVFIGPALAVVTLVYIDTVCLTSVYLSFAWRCTFSYKGQEM